MKQRGLVCLLGILVLSIFQCTAIETLHAQSDVIRMKQVDGLRAVESRGFPKNNCHRRKWWTADGRRL